MNKVECWFVRTKSVKSLHAYVMEDLKQNIFWIRTQAVLNSDEFKKFIYQQKKTVINIFFLHDEKKPPQVDVVLGTCIFYGLFSLI